MAGLRKRGKQIEDDPYDRPTHLADAPFVGMSDDPDEPSAILRPPSISDLPISPDTLTSDMARAVRFRTARPTGYFFGEVDAFVQQTIRSLEAVEERMHALETAHHETQVENDHLVAKNQRLQATIEIFKVNGAPVANEDGSYMTESQRDAAARMVADAQTEARHATARAQEETAAAARRAENAEAAAADLADRLAAAEAEAESLREYAAQAQAYVQQVTDWARTQPAAVGRPDSASSADGPPDQSAGSAQPPLDNPAGTPALPSHAEPDDTATTVPAPGPVAPEAAYIAPAPGPVEPEQVEVPVPVEPELVTTDAGTVDRTQVDPAPFEPDPSEPAPVGADAEPFAAQDSFVPDGQGGEPAFADPVPPVPGPADDPEPLAAVWGDTDALPAAEWDESEPPDGDWEAEEFGTAPEPTPTLRAARGNG